MFSIGDSVRFLDGTGEGTVVHIDRTKLIIDVDGLEIPVSSLEVVKVEFDSLLQRPLLASDRAASEKLRAIDAKKGLQKLKPAKPTVYELDLHIDELLENHRGMSKGEILAHQMKCCREFVHEARRNKYQRIILIHGVGEGVLKSEIQRWLDTLPYVEYYDAPYRTYGYGATELRIRVN